MPAGFRRRLHIDIVINQRIEYYLNNTITLRPLSPHIMPVIPTRWRSYRGRIFCDVISPCVLGRCCDCPVIGGDLVDGLIPAGWGRLILMYSQSTSGSLSQEQGQRSHALATYRRHAFSSWLSRYTACTGTHTPCGIIRSFIHSFIHSL